MQLTNSLTKTKQEFTPLSAGKASLYSCGPTVYNNLHIGNLSAFIYADTLRRALTLNGLDVQHVMNITDVDDKTIRDSKIAYPEDDPMTALKKLTDKYTRVFMDDLRATGNDTDAIQFISAVDSIPDMIALTQKLLDNDFAYIADDAVYFAINKYIEAGNAYGKLQNVEVAESQSRIANDEYDKDSASDFALWKRAEDGEPAWPATFSHNGQSVDMPGRPGWHIECSAMSEKTLGAPFDIHTGGIDLKFPHHENEIAQTIGAGASDLASIFVHNNHILVDGRKMAKSAGNFYTLRDVEERGFDPQTFRLTILESHYQNESNFTWDILEASKNRLQNWQAIADLRWQLDADDEDVSEEITTALADDLDTPEALKIIDKYFDRTAAKGKAPNPAVLQTIRGGLGIDLLASEDIGDEQKEQLKQRAEARTTKDWAKSDQLRDELAEQGISVRDDAAHGQIWFRV